MSPSVTSTSNDFPSLLSDIATAREGVQTRANNLAGKLRSNGFSYDNADQSKSWDGRWFSADKERLRQMDLLSTAVQSGDWTKQLDNEVATRKEAGFKQGEYGHRQGEDKRQVAAAGSGTAGGSWDAVVQAQNAQELARIKATVTQQVDELRAAGIQNLDEMGRQLLSKAISGAEETGAMTKTTQGTQSGYQTDNMINQNDEQYRGLLASTLTNFLNTSVTPAITGGFQSADRWNSQQRENYTDARDSGAYSGNFRDWEAANGGSRSWWGM
jgi:hypothetical protein